MRISTRWFAFALERSAVPVRHPLNLTRFQTSRAPWWCGNVGPLAFVLVWWKNEPGVRPGDTSGQTAQLDEGRARAESSNG